MVVNDPIENMNFTGSLKESIKASPGLSFLIQKEVNEMNRRLLMDLEELLKEPDIEYKLTELRYNEKGTVYEIIYDGVQYS